MITSLVMYAWFPFTLGLFLLMPPKRAVLWSLFLAFLFLPMARYPLPGFPDYTKTTATVGAIFAGIILFDLSRITSFRPRWFDLPYVAFTFVAPFGASISNDLGPYDGVSESIMWIATWLLPYLIGRMYFTTIEDVRTIVICMIFGALAYVPICLFEIRFSPQLHNWIYGFHQHHFGHAIRAGGFRPRGFMQSDLLTGMWMCSGAMICFWVWRSGQPLQLGKFSISGWIATPMLAATALLSKTVGAFILNVGALGVLLGCWLLQTRIFMIALIVSAPMYMLVRANGLWDVQNVIEFARSINPDRAQSLEFRIDNETILLEKAMQRPIFGWGGWGRARVRNEWGSAVSVADGMWVILIGKCGIVGLGGWVIGLALPAVLFVWRFPPSTWWTRTVAPLAAGAAVLSVYQLDCLLNAMENPINLLLAGTMMSYLMSAQVVPRRAPVQQKQAVPRAALPSVGAS